MSDSTFDAVAKAAQLDELAYPCLQLNDVQEIERRECSQALFKEVASLTQEQANAVGKVYEQYSMVNAPPQNRSIGHEPLFLDSTSPVITGFNFIAPKHLFQGYTTLRARLEPAQIRPLK